MVENLTTSTDKPEKDNAQTDKPDLLESCRIMWDYAQEEGKAIPAELQEDLSKLDRFLVSKGKQPMLRAPYEFFDERGSSDLNAHLELLIKVHSALVALIAPATPLSLLATGRERKWFWGRYIDAPWIIRVAIITAILFMIGFILTLPKPDWVPGEPLSTIGG